MAVLGADREGQRQQRSRGEGALLEKEVETENEVLKHSGASWANTQTDTREFHPANLARFSPAGRHYI